VRRQLEHLPEHPLFALGVRRKPSNPLERLSPDTVRKRDLALQQRLSEVPVPGECFILVLNHRGRRERAIFEDVPGAALPKPDA